MKIEVKRVTSWERVLNACRMTVNKKYLEKEPDDEFKKKLIRAEHSPLRLLEFDVTFHNVPYWVHTELVRHHIGVEKFVTTSRPDRTGSKLTRHEMPQDAPVSMMFAINAQSFINISKLRLCHQAAKETREIWGEVIDALREVEPLLADACVPSCIYRGCCPEIKSCGFDETRLFLAKLSEYQK